MRVSGALNDAVTRDPLTTCSYQVPRCVWDRAIQKALPGTVEQNDYCGPFVREILPGYPKLRLVAQLQNWNRLLQE